MISCDYKILSNIIGASDAITEVFALMAKAIVSGSDVLITGQIKQRYQNRHRISVNLFNLTVQS